MMYTKLVEGRDLILGGVKIDWEKGLLGHSDADVLLHAIMDALLGAAALGDIGRHFPDTDEKYKGISSIKLLQHVGALLEENMYVINNIDATIIAQKPKMMPHIEKMRENVAKALNIEKKSRSISRQQQKRDLDLPEVEKVFLHRQSVHFKMPGISWQMTV